VSLTANATTDYTIAGSGALTGQGRLVKQSSGTLIIDVTNNLSGGTLISAGTLQIGQGGATGTSGGRRDHQQRSVGHQPRRYNYAGQHRFPAPAR
jgi:fibronectin-binding autotransporter adhesin